MLQSYSPIASPSSSPLFQYAPSSKSLPGSSLSRRASRSRIANPPTPQRPQYVDAATQWSPKISVKMKSSNQEPRSITGTTDAAKNEVAVPTLPIIPAPTASSSSSTSSSSSKPLVPPESPGMKRRQAEPATTTTVNSSQPDAAQKRVRPDQREVKVLPAKYELCPVEDLVVLIATMIQELINTNDNLPLRTGVLTRFHSRTPPGISVYDYLQRLTKHATLIPPILLAMVYYIDRLCLVYPAFIVNSLTVHRFLITSATVASKGLSDSFWNNSTYARVGGIKVAELGLLELDFLYRVDWKIVPSPEVLVDYYNGLVERTPGYKLEDESSSGVDSDEEDQEDSGKTENIKTQTQDVTDEKWKAWMHDVSSRTVGPSDDGPST